MKKRAVILLLAGLLAAGSLTGCGSLEDSDVVATVNDTDITAGVANFLARYTQAQYETYYAGYMGDDMWSGEGEDGETYQDTVKDSILESLENMYLMEQHMDEYEVSLSDEEKNAIKEAASEFDSANGLSEKEKVSGSTDNVERVLELLTIQKKVQDAIEAGADTEVSDEEAAQKSMQYVVFPFTSTDEEGNSVDLTDEEKAELKTTAESFAAGAAGRLTLRPTPRSRDRPPRTLPLTGRPPRFLPSLWRRRMPWARERPQDLWRGTTATMWPESPVFWTGRPQMPRSRRSYPSGSRSSWMTPSTDGGRTQT